MKRISHCQNKEREKQQTTTKDELDAQAIHHKNVNQKQIKNNTTAEAAAADLVLIFNA